MRRPALLRLLLLAAILLASIVVVQADIAGIQFEEDVKEVSSTIWVRDVGDKRAHSVSGKLRSTYPWVDTANRSVTLFSAEILTNTYGNAVNFTFGNIDGELLDAGNNTIDSDTFLWDENVSAGNVSDPFTLGFAAENSGEIAWLKITVPVTIWREDGEKDTYTDEYTISLREFVATQQVENVIASPESMGRGGDVTVQAALSFWEAGGRVMVKGASHEIRPDGTFQFPYVVPRDAEAGTHTVKVNASTALRDVLPISFTLAVQGDVPHIHAFSVSKETIALNETIRITLNATDIQTPARNLSAQLHYNNATATFERENDLFVLSISGTQLGQGEHTLVARVEDEEGNTKAAEARTVSVGVAEREGMAGVEDTKGGALSRLQDIIGTGRNYPLYALLILLAGGVVLLLQRISVKQVEKEEEEGEEGTGVKDYFARTQELEEKVEKAGEDQKES